MALGKYSIEEKRENIELNGIPSSGDISFGKVIFLDSHKRKFSKKINQSQVPDEINKLEKSILKLEIDFNNISNELNAEFDTIAEMYQLNILLLNDPIIIDEIKNKINSLCSVAYSVEFIFNKFIKQLKNSNDILLKERAELLDEIKNLLLNNLLNSTEKQFNNNDVIVAKNIPSNLLYKFKESNIAGFASQEGGLTSHSSIIARAFNITSVINIKNLIKLSKKDDYAIIDAINGKYIINPSIETINHYKKIKKDIDNKNKKLLKILNNESKTKDGKGVLIKSNLDNLIELQEYNVLNSDGIGLVRTEMLFKTKDIFNETKQIEYYSQISKNIYPKTATIRIFDIGSDKYPDGFKFKENNPALGVRGIRFLFQNITIFKKQIIAILKSSELKNIKILIPMISNIEDVKKTLKIINDVKEELSNKNILFDKSIQIGFMIETPSAAMIVKDVCQYADFLSIGTNDLSQYLFAADRTNKDTAEYLNNNSPLLFKVITNIVETAHTSNTKVSICGEIAFDINLTQKLIGTGIDELSLSFSNIAKVKNELIHSNYMECRTKLEKYIEN